MTGCIEWTGARDPSGYGAYFAAKGVPQNKLARLHKVDPKTITLIVHRRTWKHA